jgi:hypothetical protein
MDAFARLPWFVLTETLSNLPDLFSLHSLYTASPGATAFLSENNAQFAQIIDAIMARPSRDRGLLPYISDLVRLLVLIWNPDAHFFAEIPKSVLYAGQQHSRPQLPVLKAVPLSTPSTLLFRLVQHLVRLRSVAHELFHSTIARCMKLPVEHLPPRDSIIKGKGMRPGKYSSTGEPTDLTKRPQGIAYTPVDIGPPTRLEEQRILGCLLCVVLYYELRMVRAESGILPETWRHLDGVLNEDVDGFWQTWLSSNDCRIEQIRTVLLWLDDRAAGCENVPSWLWSVTGFAEETTCCRHYTLITDDEEEWDETKDRFMNGEPAIYFELWRAMISPHSPICWVEFRTFRPYGLVFWEDARVIGLGYPLRGNPMPRWYALSSIFSEQDWEGIIERQRTRRQSYPHIQW